MKSYRLALLSALVVLLTAACWPRPFHDDIIIVNDFIGIASVTPRPTRPPHEAVDIQFTQANRGLDYRNALTTYPGDSLTIDIVFVPIVYTEHFDGYDETYQDEIGYTIGADISPASASSIAEIWFCHSYDAPCRPQRLKVSSSDHYSLTLSIDWLGSRPLFLSLQFRDAAGYILPYYDDENVRWEPGLYDIADLRLNILSSYNARTPFAALPAPIQAQAAATATAVVAATETQTAFTATHVTGSVVFNDGVCCVVKIGGSTPIITAAFQASSPYGQVTEMRLRAGLACDEPDAFMGDWEPFDSKKHFTRVNLFPNQYAYHISVQYRDEKGNISPVYCDSIDYFHATNQPAFAAEQK